MPDARGWDRRIVGRALMIPPFLEARWTALREGQQGVSLYALVDGIQYEQETGSRIEPDEGPVISLFKGTVDEGLAHAGPWLVDMHASAACADRLVDLEQKRPSIVWLFALSDTATLATLLRERLSVRLPDGKEALLRFWDPRALDAICRSMRAETRFNFFNVALEWHYLLSGQRFHINPHA